MKATGEVMAIDRTFEAALQKPCARWNSQKKPLLWEDRKGHSAPTFNTYPLENPRIYGSGSDGALRRGIAPQAIHDKTKSTCGSGQNGKYY